ncbi:RT0821/Lpp0805 family surface protein [Beijerinckia indica]|nr:RT0821/Lpp0805 family surface protein [Beijerinckia indica]
MRQVSNVRTEERLNRALGHGEETMGPTDLARSKESRSAKQPIRLLGGLPLIVITSALMGGCSVSIPMSPLIDRETVTGSLPSKLTPPLPLAPGLDDEDRRLAKTALATALDPTANGRTIEWANPRSGVRGSFTAVGKAPDPRGRTCATFIADVIQERTTRPLRGRACAEHAGAWTIVEIERREGSA